MGEIFDLCCDNRINNNENNEFDKEIITSSRQRGIIAVKNKYDNFESTQRKKTNFQSDDSDNYEGMNKNKLQFTMNINKCSNEEELGTRKGKLFYKDYEDNRNNDYDDGNNSHTNDSINLDYEKKTKSKMIPFIDDIPLGTSGGGFALPLQRYKYEDVDLNAKFAKKKIKKMINKSNSTKKNKSSNKKDKNEKEDTNDINFVSSIQKSNHDHLTIFLTYPGTQIHKSLFKNPKELLISFEKILRLDENAVVFDGDIVKMSFQRSGCKIVQKYFQITKDYFKYFNSISSQQVYKNKPLLQIVILDIEKIEITNENLFKLKSNSIQFAFKMILDDNKSYDFGCDDADYGANIISILTILKRYAFQRLYKDNNNQPDFKLSIDDI